MRIQVLALYFDGDGNPIWNYQHIEEVPYTGDPEQMALAARGLLDQHLDGAKKAIATQSDTDLKQMGEGDGSRESGGR